MSDVFTIVRVFPEKDEEDAWAYDVLFDGDKLVSYGDDYHDNGLAKCYGFIEGFCLAREIYYKEDEIKYKKKIQPDRFC